MASQPIAAPQGGKEFSHSLSSLGTSLKVADTRAVVGAERYRQSREMYESVKLAKEDVPGLQAVYETLSAQFEGQGPNGEEPRAPGAAARGTRDGWLKRDISRKWLPLMVLIQARR